MMAAIGRVLTTEGMWALPYTSKIRNPKVNQNTQNPKVNKNNNLGDI